MKYVSAVAHVMEKNLDSINFQHFLLAGKQ